MNENNDKLQDSSKETASSTACVMPPIDELRIKRDTKTVYLIIAALANACAASENKIIDLLTSYLWDKEEAEILKKAV